MAMRLNSRLTLAIPHLTVDEKGDIYLNWLNPDHEPEGESVAIGWNEKIGRYQEYRLEDDNSSETFKPELRNPPHHNSKPCRKCP